jgi:hypothetical protein
LVCGVLRHHGGEFDASGECVGGGVVGEELMRGRLVCAAGVL